MIPQYKPLINRESLAKEVSDYILSDGYFTEFIYTKKFEEEIAKFLNVKYCTVVNNGTISLSLALLAHGIKAGDYVLVPNITMIATSNAVKLIGAKPIFIDVDPNNLCMNLNEAKNSILYFYNNVKAVIYVTLNGRSHSIEQLKDFEMCCIKNNIAFIQDNAQSFGSEHNDRSKISCPMAGIGSFSFSMPKIITTGQGGCLVTNDYKLNEKIRKLKDFGREKGGIDLHDEFGINSKFTEIQAIMGLNQLQDIDERTWTKKQIYNYYNMALAELVPHKIQFIETNYIHNTCPWFVDIYTEKRNELQEFLKQNGIGTRIIYPELSSQKTNQQSFMIKHLKYSSKFANTGLWLPSSMDLTWKEVGFICDKIKEFFK